MAGTAAVWVIVTVGGRGTDTSRWSGENTTGGGLGQENGMNIMDEQPGNFWNGGEFGFYLRGSPDNVHLHSDPEKGDAPGTAPVSPILLTDGLWHHIAGTWGNEDGKAKLYFNGQLLHEIPYSSDTSYPLSNIYLGQMANGVRTFTGLLDDVGIWNRALSAAEVAGVTSGGIPVPAQAVPGLIAYWPFDGNLYDAIFDNHVEAMVTDDIGHTLGQFVAGIALSVLYQFFLLPGAN